MKIRVLFAIPSAGAQDFDKVHPPELKPRTATLQVVDEDDVVQAEFLVAHVLGWRVID
jgi:hypothetical protein